jgi:pyruvate dehydrogenase E2 component (dihydrolipoamide acetyltransferase)
MPNLDLIRKKRLSPFRKIAIGTWQTAYDPSVYGTLSLRMEEALRYLEKFREATGKHVTVSHLMVKAAAAVLQAMPDANAILRFNRIYLRQRIGVFFQIAMEDARTGELDLSGAIIHDPEKKSLEDIVDECAEIVAKVRSARDKNLESTRTMFRHVPHWLLNRLLKMISFFSYSLNLDLRWMGVPSDPFGSMMITNIGSLGLEEAYVPLVPYSRVPLLVALGSVEDAPVAENGQIVCGKIMRVSATFDHRIMDGSHAATMAKVLRQWIEHPFEHFDPLPASSASPEPAAKPASQVVEPNGRSSRSP